MKEPQNHLASDLRALRYLDALNAGDLETVSALWEQASRDPEHERILAELDDATFQEVLGNSSVRREGLVRRRHWAVWGGAVGSVAAACLLVILAWPQPGTTNEGSNPRSRQNGEEVANQTLNVSHNLTPLLDARRDMDEAAMPRFVWPLENQLSASTPLDLLD
jgi:hypothetical protein